MVESCLRQETEEGEGDDASLSLYLLLLLHFLLQLPRVIARAVRYACAWRLFLTSIQHLWSFAADVEVEVVCPWRWAGLLRAETTYDTSSRLGDCSRRQRA